MVTRELKQEPQSSRAVVCDGLLTPDASFSVPTLLNVASDLPMASIEENHHMLATRADQPHTMSPVKSERATEPARHGSRNTQIINRLDGIQLMGKHVQILQQAISDLEKLGVESVVPLPKLVVVGDQSSGKSSVIGGLAEIDLPRSSGTCTRCPYYIQTKADNSLNASWRCKVTIQKRYRYLSSMKVRKISKTNPLGPWERLATPEDVEFITIRDKAALSEAVRCAQIAILNPSKSPRQYIPSVAEPSHMTDSLEVQFSPNIVSMEITGPGLPALSFYDLPGIIQNADEEILVKVVESLVREYITEADALILCALPMSGDPANSSAISCVKANKAQNRCIGVLTKPDLLQPGEIDHIWSPILKNEVRGFQFAHGWSVTKQLGPNEYATDHAHARALENTFFENTSPWRDQLIEHKDQFGTEQLRELVSQALTLQIKNALPEIKASITARATEIDEELNELPPPPSSDVFAVVLGMLRHLSDEIKGQIRGGAQRNVFQRDWMKMYQEFKVDIVIGNKPLVRMAADLNDGSGFDHNSTPQTPQTHRRIQQEVVTLLDDDESSPSPSMNRKRAASNQIARPAKNMKVEMRAPASVVRASPLSIRQKLHRPRTYALTDIRQTIQNFAKTHLPGCIDPHVVEHLAKESFEPWELVVDSFVHKVVARVRQCVTDPFDSAFKSFAQTPLFQEGSQHLNNLLAELEADLRASITRMLRLHTSLVFTANEEAYELNKKAELHTITTARRERRARCAIRREDQRSKKPQQQQQQQQQTAEQISKSELDRVHKISDERVEAELGVERFGAELQVAAEVRGYYITAAHRFVDCVCMCVQGDFFQAMHDRFQADHLERALGLLGPDGHATCRRLMEPTGVVAEQRRALMVEREKLQRARENVDRVMSEIMVAALEAGSGGGGGDGNGHGHDDVEDDDDDIVSDIYGESEAGEARGVVVDHRGPAERDEDERMSGVA